VTAKSQEKQQSLSPKPVRTSHHAPPAQ
jgi:hypothetical protein